MASNRLFLYDPETNTAVCIAKGYSSGWSSHPSSADAECENEFFDNAQEFTCDIDSTRYQLKTEIDLPTDTKIYWRQNGKARQT